MSESPVTAIIAAREPTHGPYAETADLYARMMAVLELDGRDIPPSARLAITQTQLKIARALCGSAVVEEHPRDIEGYNRLWADDCRGLAP